MTKTADNTFRSRVGDQPTFFVPDTGTPGGSAVLVTPDGTETAATESVLSRRVPNPDNPNAVEEGDMVSEGMFGPRVGFKVPHPFTVEGEHRFVITQDDVVTEYFIDVAPAKEG